MASTGDLDALVSLITTSVNEIKAECLTAGISPPSLNASSVTEYSKMERESSLKTKKAIKIIEAACAQLCATVMRPEDTLVNKGLMHELSACLQVAASQDIASLFLNKPDGVHISKLSESSKINVDYLSRILRLLATNHVFQEVSPNVFANNKVSVRMATSESTKEAVDIMTREMFKASAFLGDFIKAEVKSPSKLVSPFQLAYGIPLMDYHNTPEGKETVAKFATGVAAWGEVTGKDDLNYAFPWTKYLSGPTRMKICDIGAGNGHILLSLSKVYKSYPFHAVVQDRPAFVELSKQLWNNEYPEAVQDGRVEFVPIDFMREPPVEGCDIYYIRHCIHNWPDKTCVGILNNVAKAMRSKPGSMLLIHEIVLQPALGAGAVSGANAAAGDDAAPAPLLSNFGAARFREYAQDINMLDALNAKERTLEEFIALGSQAGLAFETLWDAGETGLVQFKLK